MSIFETLAQLAMDVPTTPPHSVRCIGTSWPCNARFPRAAFLFICQRVHIAIDGTGRLWGLRRVGQSRLTLGRAVGLGQRAATMIGERLLAGDEAVKFLARRVVLGVGKPLGK